ncbi:MAG: histidine phosphatase family protein [Bacteroidota bacterium]
MSLVRLYLVRHGVTDWNEQDRVQGHTPTSLNETGRRQADLLGRFFARCPLGAVWASDLPRAYETAEHIAAPHGLAVRRLGSLRERNLGPFEGLTGEEVRAALKGKGRPRGDLSWYEVEGVEQDEEVLARVWPVLEEARGLEGEAVLVTHGGVQKAVLFRILGLPSDARRAFALGNGLVVALVPRDEGWFIEGIFGLEAIGRLLS